MSIDPSAGPALRVRLTARAASARAYARSARRPGPAWLVLEEVGVRTARRAALAPAAAPPMSWLAALHAPLDDGPRHADIRHAANAVARELAADDEAQPPAQRGDDERARLLLRARPHVAPLPRRQPVGRHREQRVHIGRGLADVPKASSRPPASGRAIGGIGSAAFLSAAARAVLHRCKLPGAACVA
jgi:hypothetical protein